MSYDPNIPNASDFLADSQGQLKINFQQLDAGFAFDHYQFSDGTANRGKHKAVEMVDQATPAGDAGQSNLWSNTDGTTSQLYYMNEASTNVYQLTKAIDASYANFGNAVYNSGNTVNAGWTFLPGGLILQYGTTVNITNAGSTLITFPVTYASAPFSVVITMNRNDNTKSVDITVFDLTTTDFKIINSSSNNSKPVFWMAIGK